MLIRIVAVIVFSILVMSCNNPVSHSVDAGVLGVVDGAYLLTATNGERLRITPYGAGIIRIQRVRAGEEFLPDTHYEMVEHHNWPRQFHVRDDHNRWQLYNPQNKAVVVDIDKKTLAVSFRQGKAISLQEKNTWWQGENIGVDFILDAHEHFTGLGHSFYGRENSIDLRGKKVGRNYGNEQIQQAPLIVPFYLSSKGYGVFLNSTFTNSFNFGEQGEYSIGINDSGFGGRLDYFFIAGPDLKQVLNNYTALTGRPRLPMKSIFGLQLSDKIHDHDSATPSDEQWWKDKITRHRGAGFPLDHVVNDNRWRAGGGKRCESRMEWDKARYPDPREYAQWLKQQGLISTIDINRCIAQFSDGWNPAFNIAATEKIEFNSSAPDLTNPQFRQWFWQIFYRQSLNPDMGYPGDALWIDEFDEMGAAPANMMLANGRSWAEMRNYWFFLIAKALVQDGWDKSALYNKRPYVWVRGMTAGAQRYASLWTGDIHPDYQDMQAQIRSMQLAGLSGFPFWGHDAGGFFDWNKNHGPDDQLYMQWAMALGSFSPIWKPHGMGESRWPLDRSVAIQKTAHEYSRLRYELMPYLYSAAHQAAATGVPIARPLLLDYQTNANAWKFDLQYMWGDSFLVAPNADASSEKTLWLPPGHWFEWQGKKLVEGDKVIKISAPSGFLPLYVKQGSIIPRYEYALSTAFSNKNNIFLDIYAGADSHAQLIEDDDTSEAYRLKNEIQKTTFTYSHAKKRLVINGAKGNYIGAPQERSYKITLYGEDAQPCWALDGVKLTLDVNENGGYSMQLPSVSITKTMIVQACGE